MARTWLLLDTIGFRGGPTPMASCEKLTSKLTKLERPTRTL
jgi:hypothetical protein